MTSLSSIREKGVRILILSEYGIEPVDHPIDVNRVLRRAGMLSVREEEGGELLDPGSSAAFAVADHQIAHIYSDSPESLNRAREALEEVDGIERILDRDAQKQFNIDHPRSGDLVLVARKGSWFNYHYWLEDKNAPDFSRTVDIHRKPGYDPLELYLDPELAFPSPQHRDLSSQKETWLPWVTRGHSARPTSGKGFPRKDDRRPFTFSHPYGSRGNCSRSRGGSLYRNLGNRSKIIV